MKDHWDLGTWSGIPVAMHWSVLLIFPWLYLFMGGFLYAAIGSLAYFALLLVHEFGHVAVARWRKQYVESITLSGTHGETALGTYGSHVDQILIAWGGVAAQLLVLVAALVAGPYASRLDNPLLLTLLGPTLIILTKWNVFLMVVALLPIGPMDGHKAWAVIPLLRKRLRLRRKRKPLRIKELSPQKLRELEKESERITADIIKKLHEHN